FADSLLVSGATQAALGGGTGGSLDLGQDQGLAFLQVFLGLFADTAVGVGAVGRFNDAAFLQVLAPQCAVVGGAQGQGGLGGFRGLGHQGGAVEFVVFLSDSAQAVLVCPHAGNQGGPAGQWQGALFAGSACVAAGLGRGDGQVFQGGVLAGLASLQQGFVAQAVDGDDQGFFATQCLGFVAGLYGRGFWVDAGVGRAIVATGTAAAGGQQQCQGQGESGLLQALHGVGFLGTGGEGHTATRGEKGKREAGLCVGVGCSVGIGSGLRAV